MPKLKPSSHPVVVAVGGNSLTQADQIGTIPEQRVNSANTCEALASVIENGHRLIVSHGNGPQVGNVLLRVELAAETVYRLPLDICGADTQGGIGYMLQQILGDKLEERGLARQVATVVTQIRVDSGDPAFENPTKPIGPYMDEDEAQGRVANSGWQVVRVGNRGYRRVVPSPIPLEIIELAAIKAVYNAGFTVICTGGGGVPVERHGHQLRGIEAVIDKDRASALLALEMGAETFIISTGVPQVLLDFETFKERPVSQMTSAEAETWLAEGQFPPGSMGPKIEAALTFLAGGGKRVLITDPTHLNQAVEGDGGTWII